MLIPTHKTHLKHYSLLFISKYKIYLLSLMAIAILASIFEISFEYKIKEIIDTIAGHKRANLNLLLGLFVFYKLMHHLSFFVSRLLDIKYKTTITEQTIIDIYTRIVKHSLHWFDSHLSGEISNKIADFQNSITTLIDYCFSTFQVIATFLITLLFLSRVNLLSTLVLGVFVLIYVPVIYWLLKKQMNLQESYIRSRQKAIGIVNDSITNIFCIKIIGNLLTEFKVKLKPAITQWKKAYKKTCEFDAYCIDNADTIMITLMSAIQIYLLAYLYQHGDITAGGFAFVAMMTIKIHTQLDTFIENLLFNISPSIAQIKSSFDFVSTPIDVQDNKNAITLTQPQGNIQYSNVSFAYGKEKKSVLKHFNLHIKAGERLGIVGPSGAGKTTLMKCLLRYFDVHEGFIAIDNHDIRQITQASLSATISIIPQDITLFHRTIAENLKLAKYDATHSEIIDACKKARIHDAILQMPKKYDTVVGERGIKLSGGQRQRIAIARAILKNAPILILDEATSSLDTSTEQLIQASIDEILRISQATVIAIAHRLSTLKHMDRIIVLDQGKIVEEGTHNTLIRKKEGIYKKLWDMQII